MERAKCEYCGSEVVEYDLIDGKCPSCYELEEEELEQELEECREEEKHAIIE